MGSYVGVHKVVQGLRTPRGVYSNVITSDGGNEGSKVEFDEPVKSLMVDDLRFLLIACRRGKKAYRAAVKAAPVQYGK